MARITVNSRSVTFGKGGNYRSYLSTMKRADMSLRDFINYYVVEALEYYHNGGDYNSNPLSEMFQPDEDGNELKGTRGIAVQEFIQDHSELVLVKKKDGSSTFIREVKEGFEYSTPKVTWYDYSKAGQAVPVANIPQMRKNLKGYVTKIQNALKGEGAELRGTKKDAEDLLKDLAAFQA